MKTYFDENYWKDQTEIIKEPPAEYLTEILPRFPYADFNAGVIMTVGGKIHAKGYIRSDYLIHELVHVKQQIESGLSAKEYIERYFEDENFRLQIELEAFGTQYKWIEENYPKHCHHDFLMECAKNLTHPLYGFKDIDIIKAISLIKSSGHYCK